MNTVILTSVLSAGNHALFAGTRVLYGLSTMSPIRQAPSIFSWTTAQGVPLPALLATSSVSVICFGSSFIGSGELWGWLQNIVGVSNQVCSALWKCLHPTVSNAAPRLHGSLLDSQVGGSEVRGYVKEDL
jgi:amino acid permease